MKIKHPILNIFVFRSDREDEVLLVTRRNGPGAFASCLGGVNLEVAPLCQTKDVNS